MVHEGWHHHAILLGSACASSPSGRGSGNCEAFCVFSERGSSSDLGRESLSCVGKAVPWLWHTYRALQAPARGLVLWDPSMKG